MRYSLLSLVVAAALGVSVRAEEKENDIYSYLNRVAAEITADAPTKYATLGEWKKARPKVRAEWIEMLGLTDVPLEGKRPPLNVTVTGSVQTEGYRIEKLYFESLPKLYVPANLYIPDGIKDRAPAILYVCGHDRSPKVKLQAHARRFVQLGFICLIIDHICGEGRGEHHGCYSRGWFHWYSRGYTPGGVEAWNGIRALDYLCGREDVDPERLGVTGYSGGGSYSWMVGALDDRVKAVAPNCGGGTVESHVASKTINGHCDCVSPVNTYLRDYHDLGALIAPRPLLITQSTADRYFRLDAVKKLFAHTKHIYTLYEQPGNAELLENPGKHGYHTISRTAIFSFFLKYLMGRDARRQEVGDVDNRDLAAKDLNVYEKKPPRDDRTPTIHDSFVKLAEPVKLETDAQRDTHRKKVVEFLGTRTFNAFPKSPPALDVKAAGENGVSSYRFVPEKGWCLGCSVKWRHPKSNPLVVIVRGPADTDEDIEKLRASLPADANIAVFEPRGVGPTAWPVKGRAQRFIRRAAAWTGRTIASMRVYDVLRCLEMLRAIPDVDKTKIGLAARGEMCAVAAYAALLDEKASSVVLENPPATQNAPSDRSGGGPAIEMLSCLRVTDLPWVIELLGPQCRVMKSGEK